jgi:hypothetical protein
MRQSKPSINTFFSNFHIYLNMEIIVTIGVTMPINKVNKQNNKIAIHIYFSVYIRRLTKNFIKYNIVQSLALL